MQTRPQATFAMRDKPRRLGASDRVEGTQARRSDGTKVGTVERLMIDKASGTLAYAVLSFGGFMGVGAKLCCGRQVKPTNPGRSDECRGRALNERTFG